MSKRKALTKTVRFEVFKRDSFTCIYCGQKPPAVVLQADHIVAVAEGGGNEMSNLVTACRDCNLGKGVRSLNTVPDSLKQQHEEQTEAELQLKEYRKMQRLFRRRVKKDIKIIDDHFCALHDGGRRFTEKFKSISLKRFLDSMTAEDICDCLDIAYARILKRPAGFDGEDFIKYFCGVCWTVIKKDRTEADRG